MTKEGYQPIKKETIKIIPPNTGSHVMKKDSYTWEDMDRSYWEGFDTAKGKIEKRIAELEKENAELRTVKVPQLERKIASIRGAHSVDCKKLNARIEQVERLKNENAELREKVERYYRLLEKSMDCETCKYCDFSDDMKKEPCNSCFFDSSKWELKEEKE